MVEYVLIEPNKYTRKICKTLKSIVEYKRCREHQENNLLMRRVCLGLQVNCILIKKMFLITNPNQPLNNKIARDMIYVRRVSSSVLGFGKHADLIFQALVFNYLGDAANA